MKLFEFHIIWEKWRSQRKMEWPERQMEFSDRYMFCICQGLPSKPPVPLVWHFLLTLMPQNIGKFALSGLI